MAAMSGFLYGQHRPRASLKTRPLFFLTPMVGVVKHAGQPRLRGSAMSVSTIERLIVTMPSDMAALIKEAVAGGDYASTSEVVREAVRDWKNKRALQLHEFATLKADLDKGLADLAAGKTTEFDPAKIIERGRKLLAARSLSV